MRMIRYALLLFALLAPPASAQACPPAWQGALADLVAGHGLAGASLRVSGGPEGVRRCHAGGYDDHTRVPIASASKWLAALTLARVVESGALRWDSRVGELFPEAPAAVRAITLEQLASHTSGIRHAPAPCLSRRAGTLDACALEILGLPLAAEPGTAFAYGGNSLQVAGAMAARATGLDWDSLFRRELVEPLGLQATDWRALARRDGYVGNANPRIAGGARSSLADYGRVVDMVLAQGQIDGRRFLSADTIAFMARDRSRGLRIVHQPPTAQGMGYGLGQWVESRDAGGRTTRASSPGAFGFTPWVDWDASRSGVLLVQGRGRAMRPRIAALQALTLANPETPPAKPAGVAR